MKFRDFEDFFKKEAKQVHDPVIKQRELLDGFVIEFSDDGTVDMGTSFDFLDKSSHYENNLLEEEFKKKREYLKNRMVSLFCCFVNKSFSIPLFSFVLKGKRRICFS